jgi:hypothetical protein
MASEFDLADLDAMIAEASSQDRQPVHVPRPSTQRPLTKGARPPGVGVTGASSGVGRRAAASPLQSAAASRSARSASATAAAALLPLPVPAEELESLELAMEREYSRELQGKLEALQSAMAERDASQQLRDLERRNTDLEQLLAAERAVSARALAEVARLESALSTATAAAPQQSFALEQLAAALAASEVRAAEERARVAEVKKLWKGVVDTMREEAEALATALEDAQVSIHSTLFVCRQGHVARCCPLLVAIAGGAGTT